MDRPHKTRSSPRPAPRAPQPILSADEKSLLDKANQKLLRWVLKMRAANCHCTVGVSVVVKAAKVQESADPRVHIEIINELTI